MSRGISSMDRTMAAIRHEQPDRVPAFLNLTMHGAKALGVPLKRYFSDPELVCKGQLLMLERFGADSCTAFTYSSAEHEAFGGHTYFYEDGPPNSGRPIIENIEDIDHLKEPDIDSTRSLMVTIEATRLLKDRLGEEVPILGLIISPFSLPVMQMGFDRYFELMYKDRSRFDALMRLNTDFEVELANRQLEAGATAIVYFDPVSSTTIIPREKFLETGFKVAERCISRIKGPTAIHFASGRFLGIADKVAELNVIGVGVGVEEDLAEIKRKIGDRLTIIGNLNGVEMPSWSEEDVDINVKEAIEKAAPGGGFILSDNHGEIPYQVPDKVLHDIMSAVERYGRYSGT
ncbi:MAG: uroporphyrinogen decarboxylase family protein [Methanomassiliicoccales archaeon]|nr:MAG: uroporphyrinogen decarboxylase family protein [Methanomassiliicoccales archaeon]